MLGNKILKDNLRYQVRDLNNVFRLKAGNFLLPYVNLCRESPIHVCGKTFSRYVMHGK